MLTDLEAMVKYAEQMVESLRNEVPPLMIGTQTSSMDTQIKFLYLLKRLKEHGEELAKFYNLCENSLCERLNKLIESSGLDSVDKTLDGRRYRFTPDTKYHINCKAEQKPAMLEWLKQHPIGKELVKEDVHPKSLESFVKKELIGKGEVPPTMISLHSIETVTMRKLPE